MAPSVWIVAWFVLVGVRLRTLTRDCYDHVQEVIRSDAHAGQHTIRATEWVARQGRPSRNSPGGLYQPTAVTPVSPFRYVWLLPSPLFLLLPIRRFLHGVVIHWTPLVRYPTAEWLDELTVAVAHFLGLGRGEVDLAEANVSRKRARIVRVSA
jgi:hypothetical protein